MPTKKTYVGRSLTIEMERSGITQMGLREISGLPQSTISQLMTSEVRVAPKTIAAITHCWTDHAANCRVLIAHLRDEIARAGHDPENAITLGYPDGNRATTVASRDLETLRAHLSDTDVAALIHDLAVLLRRAERAAARDAAQDAPQLAADPAGPAYKTREGGKKQ